MLFAKRVFQAAAIWGIGLIGLVYAGYLAGFEQFDVYTNHTEYVHGFMLVTLAWQIAFLIIATNPVRYRLLMLAAMLEKFPFTLVTLILYATAPAGEANPGILVAGLVDGLFGVLFAVSYVLTERPGDEG